MSNISQIYEDQMSRIQIAPTMSGLKVTIKSRETGEKISITLTDADHFDLINTLVQYRPIVKKMKKGRT